MNILKMADLLRRPASQEQRNARRRVSKRKTGVPNKEKSQSKSNRKREGYC